MHLIQCHFGPIHPERQKCLDSVSRAYPNTPRTFVDMNNYEPIMADMMRDLNVKHRPRSFRFDHIKCMATMSDWLTGWLLTQYADGLRLCSDVMAIEKWSEDNVTQHDLPYMWRTPYGNADYAVTYSNGCAEYFRFAFRNCMSKGKFSPLLGLSCNITYEIPNRFFRHLSCEAHEEEHWQKYWGFNVNE